ncbi:MAG: DNA replication/repair protein RecF [Pseudomonadota bacterium]
MWLKRLVGNEFRNFSSFALSPSEKINLVYGANGSGKTSLLEAIYLFGFGRSFRPGGFKPLIKEGTEKFTVFAEVASDEKGKGVSKFGLSRHVQGQQELRIDGNSNVRLADLARSIPVQLFTPESVEVILGGPGVRRQLLDWGVFHVEHSFFSSWSNYNKVLKHRNRLLKSSREQEAPDDRYWQQQLAVYGEKITELRQSYVEQLTKYLQQMTQSFLPNVILDVSLRAGWDSSKSLSEALAAAVSTDRRYGYTSVGPHKADLLIVADGAPAKERLSRGQLKVVVAGLKLAQAEFYRQRCGENCVIIVDDLSSELDQRNQKIFCRLLEEIDNQVFITTVNPDDVSDKFKEEPKMFHVEHGILKSHIEN